MTGNANGLVITVDDDTPIATTAQVTGTVDEDGVLEGAADAGPGDGIAGGTGDVGGQATVANGSVATLFQSGADEPLTYGFTANAVATLQALGLTSGGVALSYAILGDTVTASTAAGNVFTFQLNATTGAWTFTLIDQLDHASLDGLAGDNTENDLLINLGAIVQATDFDGDSVTGNANGLVITVDDDTPIATTAQVTGTVDEDGVLEGAADAGPGDGIAGGTGDVGGQATVANGSVATLFQSGADEPLTYGFTANAVATLQALGLTSGGVALSYAILGDTVTASTAAGNVFTFQLNATTGAWTFTLIDQLDHASLDGLAGDNTENDLLINLGAIVQATDFDGDSVTGNANGLVITVDDDTPIATTAQVTGTVDEDGVLEGAADAGPGDGIAGGTGDVGGQATVANGSVATLFQSGADEPLTYGFTANAVATLQALGLTSGGVALSYAILGDTVTASTAAGNVFTFQLNATTGAWTFTLIDQLDHASLDGLAGDNTENDLLINLGAIVQATDFDGDSVTGNANGLVITVDDDTPIATTAQVTGTVDEDGVLEGAADAGPGDGIAGGTGDVGGQATVANGSVATLFQSGADEPLTYGFTANAVATLQALGLTSGGVALSYAILGDTVTASTAAGNVFTFQLNATTGAWTFTLIDQLDHASLDGLAGDNTENDLLINLGAIVQATDFDGDSVTGNANGLVITVDDDTPIATTAQVTGTVDEDGVLEGAADAGPGDGIAGGTGDVGGQATVANGSVATLFQSGADEPLTYGFTANAVATLQALGLTSGGVALSYAILGDTVTASTAAGNVFTFQLNATTGAWTFTLIDQLDHASLDGLAGDNTENDLLINLGAIVQATDFDGDSVTGNANGLVITVDDDTPIATTAQVTGTVDEDGVLEGAADAGPGDGIAGGTGDVGGQATVANGSVATLFQSGADEPLTYGFTANAVATLQALGLTSGGVALSYAILGDTVTASTAAGNVFTFQLNATTGAWTFTLIDQLDHASLDGLAGDNTENDLLINLGAIVQATDFDGDLVTGNANGLVITVDDDTPIATTAQVTGTVDEDGVLEGAADAGPGDGIAGGTGDVGGQATVANGSVATSVPVWRGRAADLWVHRQCGCDVAGAGPDVGRRCAELCDSWGHGDGVYGGRQRLHVPAERNHGCVDIHAD